MRKWLSWWNSIGIVIAPAKSIWKPYPPIYPKLVRNVADGLTFEETKELRNRGLNSLLLMKLRKCLSERETIFPTRNGVNVNVVDRVKEAIMILLRLDCTLAGTSDCKRTGAKLRDLVSCDPFCSKTSSIYCGGGNKIKNNTPSAFIDHGNGNSTYASASSID
ncbi:hypothetical protein ACLB2K_022769 [Fragaria x ananassa]